MVGTLAVMLLSAAAASSATPCESLASLKLDKASVTTAQMVAEGPAPARGRGRGARPDRRSRTRRLREAARRTSPAATLHPR